MLQLSTVGKSESRTPRQGTIRYKGVHVSKHEICELQEIEGKGWAGMNRGVDGNEIGEESGTSS